jgi:CubicO group peptidase (beta-lactamase class C family)
LSAVRLPLGDPSAIERVHGGTTDGETPVTPETLFETGSVFKLFTAMALADMAESGETSVDRTVAEVFPDADILDPQVADATLEDLATHHSGLPTASADDLFRHYVLPSLVFSDAYGNSRDPVSALAVTPAATPGEYGYSNLGFSLLGEALVAEAGAESYEALVRERVLDPLGMNATVVFSGVPEGGAPPHVAPGHPSEPWHNTDYAPAGVATWSTPDDLARFLSAVADGSAPGMGALEPVHRDVSFTAEGTEAPAPEEDARGIDFSSFDQGLGWVIVEDPELGRVRLHTGGTLGSGVVLHAATVGTNGDENSVFSESAVSNFTFDFGNNAISADFIMAIISVDDNGTIQAHSMFDELTIDGSPVAVTGEANQRIRLRGGYVVLNEQVGSGQDAVVNAMRIHVNGAGDVVVASARAGM